MTIESLCRRQPVTLDATLSLQEAALLMREEDIGCLIVTAHAPEGDLVIGVVTDRDLAVEVLARGRDGTQVPLAAIVSGRLVTSSGDASLSEALALMADEGVRRLLVTGEDQELLGVVSIDDIVEHLAADLTLLARALRGTGGGDAGPASAGAFRADPRRRVVPDAQSLAAWRHETTTA